MLNRQLLFNQSKGVGLRRGAWAVLAWLSIAVGTIGIFLPLLPTTPFILLAAWAAPKASPRLHHWLHTHPQFGPILQAWRDEGAVPPAARITAGIMLILSWSLLVWLRVPTFALWLTGLLFAGVMAFLMTRPNPRRN